MACASAVRRCDAGCTRATSSGGVLGRCFDRRTPNEPRKLREIRTLLRNLRHDEVPVFQDEVDINTNPKIGSMWIRQGQQAEVNHSGQQHQALPGWLDELAQRRSHSERGRVEAQRVAVPGTLRRTAPSLSLGSSHRAALPADLGAKNKTPESQKGDAAQIPVDERRLVV